MDGLPAAIDLEGMSLVVGLGQSGLSAVRLLASRGRDVMVTDSRPNPPALAALRRDWPNVPYRLNGFCEEACARAARLILSPGVSSSDPLIAAAAARGLPVIGDVELFARLATAPVAAITGSNGKSTVTTLLGRMAAAAGTRVAVGGNLGPPALDLLDESAELYVLELSSFQLETTTSLHARAACVLNLSPDHLDRYAAFSDYAAAKQRIFRGHGAMILNADDAAVMAMAEPGRTQYRFTLGEPSDGEFGRRWHAGEQWLACGSELGLPMRELGLNGVHNHANALAALAMGRALDLPLPAMLAALREFRGLPHRCELVAERAGVRWFNDSKGTNVGATVAAIEGLPGSLVLLAGGDGKGQDFRPLAEAARHKVKAAVLFGRDAARIAAALAGTVPFELADDLTEAIARAEQHAVPGDNVVLSPACASLDMFANYEARGQAFVAAVRALPPC